MPPLLSSVRLACALFFIGAQAGFGQGTRSDYERALSVGRRVEGRVFGAKVRAQWLAGNDAFWWVNERSEGRREFLFCDAVKGEVRAAFDHARLAAALAKVVERAIDPERLPVERLAFDEARTTVRFSSGGKRWECRLGDYALRESTEKVAALAPDRKVRPSQGTGEETTITFVNRTDAEARCFWIDEGGGRQPYATLKPGQSFRQHTFVGHVWLVTSKDGKTLGVFEAGESGAEAFIESRAELEVARTEPPPSLAKKPASPWKVFIRDANVFAANRETKEELRLSGNGTPDDPYVEPFVWSPDGMKFVARQVRKGDERKVTLVESSPADQLQPKVHEVSYPKPGDRIPQERPRLFDLEKGRQIPVNDELFQNPWDISELRWSPDGRRFTFLFNQRGHQLMRVISVDAASGEASVLVEERSPTFIDYSQKTFLHWLDATNELVWMSERDGWNHLWLYDSASGQVKNQITCGEWVVRKVEQVDAARRQIWFAASGIRAGEDPYYLHLARVNFDGTGLVF